MLHLPRTLGSIVLLAGLAVFLIAQEDGCNSDENGEEADGTTPAAETATLEPTAEPTPAPSPEPSPPPSPESAPEVTPESGGTSYSEDDTEYKLASIDAGEELSVDDPSIGTYAGLLDSLDDKCNEERSLIGDQAVRATQLLADEGISVTILEALRGIDGSIPEDYTIVSCAEIGAVWIALVVAQ